MNLNQEVASLLQLDGPNLVRDKFNTRKLIIAAADNGKVCILMLQCCVKLVIIVMVTTITYSHYVVVLGPVITYDQFNDLQLVGYLCQS